MLNIAEIYDKATGELVRQYCTNSNGAGTFYWDKSSANYKQTEGTCQAQWTTRSQARAKLRKTWDSENYLISFKNSGLEK